MKYLIVLCHVPDLASAEKISKVLLNKQLASCINILPACRSLYNWRGRLEEKNEIPLIIKTNDLNYAALQSCIVELHPYDIPEIIAFPIEKGLPSYINWLGSELKQ